jgi:hypothetical protein
MTRRIRAHFDGRVLVPDEPVDLPLHQPLEVDVTPAALRHNGDTGAPAAAVPDLNRFAGKLSLREDPLEYQRRARDEWR